MKIAYSWLKKFISIDASPEEIAEKITLSGLEVENIEFYESIQGSLEGVIVAQVIECEQHPNADKLKKCKVYTGKETLEVICGAPNVAVNQKVLLATVGTTLYPKHGEPLVIKSAKIRGEISNGMICAEDELGIGDNHEGILVLPEDTPIGLSAKEYFKLCQDIIFEIGLTPNRTDAMSHFGVAREIAALYKTSIHFPEQEINAIGDCPVKISVEDTESCPLYAGLTIQNIQVQESPQWLKDMLLSVGQRPINNVVDVTNFVLLGLGQPLHAFDLKKIKQSQIIVRKSQADEKLIVLDKTEKKLTGNELVIANPEEAMCIAGVMGGLESAVNEQTTSIFLESAFFNPSQIRLSVQKTGLRSESSYRFERGIDPNRVIDCLKYAANLIQQLAGGIISNIVFKGQTEYEPHVIPFNYQKANKLIGFEIHKDTYHQIFQSLDFQLQRMNEDNIKLLVPRYRHDVTRFQDVMEEFLRIYGLNQIPTSDYLSIPLATKKLFSDYSIQWNVGNYIAGRGWNEIETNSLIAEKWATSRTVRILNKLSEDHAHLRHTLLWGGLLSIQHNLNRQNPHLKFFEWGKVYENHQNKPIEKYHLAFWLTGHRFPENWLNPKQKSSVFEIQSLITDLFQKFHIPFEIETLENSDYFDQGLTFVHNNQSLAYLGSTQSSILKSLDIKQEVFFGWIEWEKVLPILLNSKQTYQPIPKYPSVRRDISLYVEPQVSYQNLEQAILKTNPKLIKEINLFDVFEDKQNHLKSYALSVVFLDENKTLTDDIVDKNMQKIFQNLENIQGVTIRK